jgi:hypothetical protein
MDLLENSWILKNFWVKNWVDLIGDMHQYGDLKIILMHVLHFILHLEGIIIKQINVLKDCILMDVF